MLKSIEKRNPKLGGSIRQRMFRFEDLVRLSPGDVAKITKEVDQDDLIIALKNASPELKKVIFSTMSKRAVEALEEQLGFLGPKRLSEVEAAQDRVIQIVRELEEDEEIILDTGGSGRCRSINPYIFLLTRAGLESLMSAYPDISVDEVDASVEDAFNRGKQEATNFYKAEIKNYGLNLQFSKRTT